MQFQRMWQAPILRRSCVSQVQTTIAVAVFGMATWSQASAGFIDVAPTTNVNATANKNGPITPSSQDYQLINILTNATATVDVLSSNAAVAIIQGGVLFNGQSFRALQVPAAGNLVFAVQLPAAASSQNPGTYQSTITIANTSVVPNQVFTRTVTLVVNGQNQAPLTAAASQSTISFGGTSNLSATGGSGTGAVSFAVVSGPCTVSNAILTATGVGTCSATATKAGDATFNAITSAPVNVTVVRANQAALDVIAAPGSIPVGATSALSTTGGSGTGSVTFAVAGGAASCSVSGPTLTGIADGTCTVTATKAADANFNSATGTGTVTITPVTCADTFASAFAISGANGALSGTTAGATGDAGEPNHAGNSGALNSVWCKWAAPANGTVSFDTTGSLFDTTLAVYTGTAIGSLTPVASNDNISASNAQSRVSFTATQGVTYMWRSTAPERQPGGICSTGRRQRRTRLRLRRCCPTPAR